MKYSAVIKAFHTLQGGVMFKKIWMWLFKNIQNPFKSVAHFIRNGATWAILMSVSSMALLPLGRLFNPAFGSNFSFKEGAIVLIVSLVIAVLTDLFIKD